MINFFIIILFFWFILCIWLIVCVLIVKFYYGFIMNICLVFVKFSLILFVFRLMSKMVKLFVFVNFCNMVVWVFWVIVLLRCINFMLVLVSVGLMSVRNDVNWEKIMDFMFGCLCCKLWRWESNVIIFVEEELMFKCCKLIWGFWVKVLGLLLWWIILNKLCWLSGLW